MTAAILGAGDRGHLSRQWGDRRLDGDTGKVGAGFGGVRQRTKWPRRQRERAPRPSWAGDAYRSTRDELCQKRAIGRGRDRKIVNGRDACALGAKHRGHLSRTGVTAQIRNAVKRQRFGCGESERVSPPSAANRSAKARSRSRSFAVSD